MIDVLYMDESIVVCIKPSGILSTDEPGGLPELLRNTIGDTKADIRTVHRLDRAVSGLMLLARSHESAARLSHDIREGEFLKYYTAVVHGLTESEAELHDLMYRDKARKMSFVTDKLDKGVQEAVLEYKTLWQAENMSRVKIKLHTGRTHQIRVQFASRGLPLLGERKYSTLDDPCELALFSCELDFKHPGNGRQMSFSVEPPDKWPWNAKDKALKTKNIDRSSYMM